MSRRSRQNAGESNEAVEPDVAAQEEAQTEVAHQTVGEPQLLGVPTTTDGLNVAALEVVNLPVDEIMPDPMNPNVESPQMFNSLVSTINEDGYDQPIVVCPIAPEERVAWNVDDAVKYVIVKGEHRWRAARVLGGDPAQRRLNPDGVPTVPCVVRNWDALTRRTRLVRDNVVKGELDKDKFTRLVESMRAEHGIDNELAPAMLGFDSAKDMFRMMVKDARAGDVEQKAATNRAKDDLKVLDDLTLVLNTIFTKHGHTLPYGYIVFMFGGRINAMFEMDDALKEQIEALSAFCVQRKLDANLVLSQLLKEGLDSLQPKE